MAKEQFPKEEPVEPWPDEIMPPAWEKAPRDNSTSTPLDPPPGGYDGGGTSEDDDFKDL